MQEELDRVVPVPDIPESSSAPPPPSFDELLRAIHHQNLMNAKTERLHQERFDVILAQNAQILSGQRSTNERLDEVLSELNALRMDVSSFGP